MEPANTEVYKAVLLQFTRELRRQHRLAGEPSYSTIARETAVSKATICRYLKGTTSPRWAVVELLLEHWKTEQRVRDAVFALWVRLRDLADPLDQTALPV
jgi:hypothetical protein